MRSKLNPHFLFNSLNSVVALVDENPQGAKQMVRDVAALLRSLDLGDATMAPLADELELTRLYLACEKVRFEERLRVTYDVDEALQRVAVPAMVLHPLVENAIKHGMAKVNEIAFINAADDYTEVHLTNGKAALVAVPLKDWEARLPADTFARAHRSALVNLSLVDDVVKG